MKSLLSLTSCILLLSTTLVACSGDTEPEAAGSDSNSDGAAVLTPARSDELVDSPLPTPSPTQAPPTSEPGLTADKDPVLSCEMSKDDTRMLALVNDARQSPRTCGNEGFEAVPALSWSCQLAEAASRHSMSMADLNYRSHDGVDGSSPASRVLDTGYVYYYVGENIAAGQTTLDEVMQGWLDSPSHCANIMSTNYTELGSASETNKNSFYGTYWTQNFASPR